MVVNRTENKIWTKTIPNKAYYNITQFLIRSLRIYQQYILLYVYQSMEYFI